MLRELHAILLRYWEQFLYILPKLAVALVVVMATVYVARRFSRLLGRRLQTRSHDPLLSEFLTDIVRWVLLLLGALVAMQIVGLSGIAGGLLTGAGVSAFIVGFAFKDIAENFLAGVILAFNRPFQIDDTVQIKDQTGHIEALNLRTTLIRTFDGKHVFLPNATVLKEPLINFTRDGNLRQDFLLSIDYGDDGGSEKVQQHLRDFLGQHPDVQHQTPRVPYFILEKTTGSTADLRVYFWTSADEYRRGTLQIKSDLMQAVKPMLMEAGYAPPALTQ